MRIYDPALTDAEFAWWQDQAALLDPAAYVWITGNGVVTTVPAGETWYALSLFNILTGDARTVTDLACTNGSFVVTSSQANFSAADVGRAVYSGDTALPIDFYDGRNILSIASVQSATSATLAGNASAGSSKSGITATIGTTLYQRGADVRKALMLPPGTTFKTSPTSSPYAYVCRPSLVVGTDVRYSDPQTLYYERLQRLRSFTLFELAVGVPYGSVEGTHGTSNFPGDFAYGMVTFVSCFDLAWVTLSGDHGLNLFGEVSDDHPQRYGLPLLMPFSTAVFPQVSSRSGLVSGLKTNTPLSSADALIKGLGVVKYHKLPSDW